VPIPDSASFPDDGGTPAEAALKVVTAVLAGYSRQLLAARRSGDQQRLQEVSARMQECTEDRDRLADAGPEEIERITDLYTERLKNPDLTGS
jgi:hypothetical protein